MKQDPYKTIIIVEFSLAEVVAILARMGGDRRTIPASERRALRTATKRLTARALKIVGKVR